MLGGLRTTTALLLAHLICGFQAPISLGDERTANDQIVVGVIDRDIAFVLVRDDQRGEVLVREPLRPKSTAQSQEADRIMLHASASPLRTPLELPYSMRFRLFRNYVWSLPPVRSPDSGIVDFPLLRAPMNSEEVVKSDGDTMRIFVANGDREDWGPCAAQAPIKDQPESGIWREIAGGAYIKPTANCFPLSSAFVESPIFYDLWPIDERKCLIFVLVEPPLLGSDLRHAFPRITKPSVVVFEYSFHCEPNDRGRKWLGIWRRPAAIEVPFYGPFHVAVVGSRCFVVGKEGDLFVGDIGKTDIQAAKKVSLPARPNERIHALLQDAITQKVYAFTQTSFFELKESLEPYPFVLGRLENVKSDDPLPTVRRCALTLRAVVPAAKQGDDKAQP